MFYKEHEPAHFHAEHRGERAKFNFDGDVLAGEIRSRRARERIRTWSRQHRAELKANWEKMKAGQPLESIAPLQERKS